MSKGENMVERCARSLALHRAEPWEDMNDDERKSWTESARAVIEALMEPDAAQHKALDDLLDAFIGDSADARDTHGVFAVRAYRAMLRTILSQPNEEGEGK